MNDYEELKAFKLQYDEAIYNEQVEEVSQMFDLSSDEISEFKEKVLNKELSIEEQARRAEQLSYAKERGEIRANVEAKNKQTGMKVIDVALKYGYESPDSFAKAFQKFHGITPSQARADGSTLKSFSRLSIKISAFYPYFLSVPQSPA